MKKISVAMATYNGAKYLPEQLDSFLQQTTPLDELIVCDDCSVDETQEILEKFRLMAPFDVQIHRNEKNLGFSVNFGKALGFCTGDLIFMSDQDDVWYPEKIAAMILFLDKHPKKYIGLHDAMLVDQNLKPSNITKLQQLQSARVDPDRNYIQGGCAVIRREFLDFALPIPESFAAHDSWLAELAGYLEIKVISPQVLLYYRIHGNNTSRYFLNRVTRVNYMGMVKHRFRFVDIRILREDLLVEQVKLNALEDRLVGGTASLLARNLGADMLQDAWCRIRRKRVAVEWRARLIERPRLLRIIPAFSMLFKGEYGRYFNGFNSFVKDLIS